MDPKSRSWRPLLGPGNLAGCLLLAVVYALLGHVSLQFSFAHPQVSTVWAPSGVALAALLLWGPRLLPGIALGAFALNAWTSGSFAIGLGIALGSSLSALAGYGLLTRIARIDVRLPGLRDVMALAFAGAAASPMLAALIGPVTLWLSGSLPAADVVKAGLLWWMGDSLGVLIFTPLVLAWHNRPARSEPREWQAVGLLLAQVITALIVFQGLLAEPLSIERSTYALLPYAVWLALVYPLRYTTVSNLLLFLIAVFETAEGLGPFSGENVGQNLLLLHLFLSVVVFTTLVVAGINAERLAAIRQARASADRFRRLSELSADWYWEQDENLRFTSVDESRGFQAVDVALQIGRTRWEIPYAGVSAEQRQAIEERVAERKPFRDLVMTRFKANGEARIITTSGYPIFDEGGRFRGYRGIGRDITELKLAESALRESETRFRSLIELSTDWYWEQGPDLKFTFISGAHQNRAGVTGEESIGRTRFEIGNQFESEALRRQHEADLEARRPFRDLILKRVRADGSVHYAAVSGQPNFDADGSFLGYRGVGRDVTALKLVEQALRESEEHLRRQIQSMPVACISLDKDFLITGWNPAAERIFGFGAAEIIGRSPYEVLIPAAAQTDVAQRVSALRAGQPAVGGFNENLTKDGRTILCRWQNVAMTNSAGDTIGYLAMAEDVTAVAAAERTVRESEERFRALTELSSDWYWEQDAELRFTFTSSAVAQISGIPASVRNGKRRWELDGLHFDPAALEEHKRLLAERKPFRDFRYTRIRDNGQRHHVSITGTPIFDADGKFAGYRGIGRNITAEVEADRRVERLRDFYAALSKANEAIIHAANEQQLFDRVCEIAVTYGHAIFARICLINAQTLTLDNVAIAGNHQGYPDKTRISLDPDLPEAQGPTAIALRTNTPDICNDIESDPRNLIWRPAMMATGARAYAIYPLQRNGRVVGSFHMYAAEKNWFDDELVALLAELVANLSFALDNFEREQARRKVELALQASEARFRDVAEAAGEFVWENDLQGRFTYVSPRAVDYTGYTPEELVGRTAAEFMPPGEGERVRQWLAENMKLDRSFRNMEHQFITRSGETLWMSVSAVSIWDAQGRPLGQRGTTRDITALKQSEARISYLATRDPLTELPNRLLFNDRLEQGIINSRRKKDELAVLFIDLDRFKNINDSLGHHIGDLLLKEVSSRMVACIRKGDTVSRLGGDEFVVTLEGLAHAEDAANVARKITEALTRPFEIGGHTLNTSCSIGISIFPNDAEDSRELMKNADTAMYHAKEQGRNNFQFFSPEMNTHAVERHRLETELRQALAANQFLLHYQPQFDLKTNKLIGMEALIRWQHPERGLVPPVSFIPVAEETGLIEPIGLWALQEACVQNRKWQDEGLPAVKVAVNISARQFNDPRGFARDIARLLHASGLEPRFLELEMTESMLLRNVDENIAVLRRLGEQGTRMAVDDFGTGYSSLAYLKQLPIDTLKIDRTFVNDIETDPDDAAIIQAIIAMAHGLELRVTAEGVETEGQLAALRKLGCDEYQGYLISRPLPAGEFAERFLLPAGGAPRRAAPAGRGTSAPAPGSRGRARRG